ncbi:MAG TPA: hypothetical protein VHB77_17675 [Planctomycetaceae bacterium]|nr:hypothetical protein [Planctomycetaceae bacterium]
MRPVLALLCVCVLAGADAPRAASTAEDVQDLVFLGSSSPLFVRLHVAVDGVGFHGLRPGLASQLFKELDRDRDGVLKAEELQRAMVLPEFAGKQTPQLEAKDGGLKRDEFAAALDAALGPQFAIVPKAKRAAQAIDLFPRLDLNGDGSLSQQELKDAFVALRKLDVDQDETYTIEELQPLRELLPAAQAAPMEVTEMPFLVIEPESRAQMAEELTRRYGSSGRVTADDLGLTAEAFAPFDRNRDGTLDTTEFAALLANPPVTADLKVTLFHKKRGRPDVVRINEATTRRPGAATLLSVPLANVGFQWRAAASAAAAASDNRNFYKIKFRQADGDKNGYLDANEFGALGLPNATFEAVDRDGDKQVFVDEVVAYADQDSTAAQHRVVMTVANEGKSLFEALDADSDRRLSRRELKHSVERLRSFDRDGDGRITPAELSGQYRVIIGLGKPSLFAEDRQNMAQMPTDPIINEPRVGPPWHRKMDRNRDGDVSWLEFLGPREQFTRLDTDGDGLISVREAEALESPAER